MQQHPSQRVSNLPVLLHPPQGLRHTRKNKPSLCGILTCENSLSPDRSESSSKMFTQVNLSVGTPSA